MDDPRVKVVADWYVTVEVDGESQPVFGGESRRKGPASVDAIVEMARAALVDRFEPDDAPRSWTIFGEIDGRRAMHDGFVADLGGVVDLVRRLMLHLTQTPA